MANVTVELGSLLAMGYPLSLDNYPIFDESYREVLNNKIIRHYFFREIGLETPDRFNFELETLMGEIMPLYNQMYEAELIKYDPLATEYFSTKNKQGREHEKGVVLKDNRKTGENVGEIFTGNIDTVKEANLTDNQKTQTDEAMTDGIDSTRKGVLTDHQDIGSKTDVSQQGSGTNNTTGAKTSSFADIPQGGVSTVTTSQPDGSVTTETDGYLTTQTVDATRQNDKTTTEETSHSSTDTTHDQTQSTDEIGTNKEKRDTAITGNKDQTQNTDETGNTKEDTERNRNRSETVDTKRNEKEKLVENIDGLISTKGRQGFSPADLIVKYRSSLINIDMLVIGELGKLFYGLW